MPSLHIFNPDTDFALASDREYYTPPARVVELRRQNALLPSLYANEGDAILILDNPMVPVSQLRYHDLAISKDIEIFTIEKAVEEKERLSKYLPDPWGWNRNIRRILLDVTGDSVLIPSEEQIRDIRRLSHRRTSIEMLRFMRDKLDMEIEIPVEISEIQSALTAYETNPRLFFKAPWSSSGRGIILTDDLERRHVEPWIKGIIRRQGSVIMEKAYDRKLDFATEWLCHAGAAYFRGYSVFNVSRRGKYHSNVTGTQEELKKIISNSTHCDIEEYVGYQQKAIESIIAPFYSGPMGIDMLTTDSGAINPCVEINLRHTMGMIGL